MFYGLLSILEQKGTQQVLDRILARFYYYFFLCYFPIKVDFHVWQFMGPRLRSVSLGGNLWGCECEFVEKLAAFIKTNPGLQVQDPQDIQCFNETLRSGNSSLTTSNCADVLAVSFRTGKKYISKYAFKILD